MKKLLLLLFAAGVSCSLCAQPAAKPRRQSMEWFESVQSPEIHPDGRVTFRLFAPQAGSVRLSSQAGPDVAMQWDDDEQVWKTTIRPAVADIYPYHFVVDGQAVSDPANREIFPNELFKGSLLLMPNPAMRYTVRDIPHGTVHYETYFSTVLNEPRTVLVYTPAGYDSEAGRRYPVLYLVSGTTDTEETWYKAGRANFILDNLIHDGLAEPMLVVMPYGNMNTGNPRPSSEEATRCYELFAQEMQQCILPLVERSYRTRTDREGRALAGFSRGGGEALYTAFACPDRFASVCAYSAYLTDSVYRERFGSLIDRPEEMNRLYRLIWFGVGDADFLLEGVRANEALFRRLGIRFEQYDTTGGHTWMNARAFLDITAQKLFKQTGAPRSDR